MGIAATLATTSQFPAMPFCERWTGARCNTTGICTLTLRCRAPGRGFTGFCQADTFIDMARTKDTRPHVIVVEDEQFQRETLIDFLGNSGYRASGVESGGALRKLVEKDPPALVLLDLRLPGEDGFVLARYLRERSRRVGIIMLTASDDSVDQVVGLETGA